MSDQQEMLLDFIGDDALSGYRLIRLEVYNWGTFDGRVWALHPDGRNSLLTGDIGSGKSTIVDAVTTLLVPAHRVAYNKAAGEVSALLRARLLQVGTQRVDRQRQAGGAARS